MLIIFNKSGNEFNVDFQYDSFSQGDSNTHIVDVIVEDTTFSNYEYNAYVQFLREGEKEPSDKLIMATKRMEYNGNYYNGYTYRMGSDWFTAIAGTLKMTIEIKKFINNELQSNKAYGVVNIPVQPSVSAQADVDSAITDEEYNAMIELINSKLNVADDKILRANTIFSNINDFYDWCFEQGTTGTNPPYRIYYGSIVDNNSTNDIVAILSRYSERLLVLDSDSSTGGIMVVRKDHSFDRVFADTAFVHTAINNVKTQLEEDYNNKINQLDLIKANDSDVVHKSGDERISGSKTFGSAISIDEPSIRSTAYYSAENIILNSLENSASLSADEQWLEFNNGPQSTYYCNGVIGIENNVTREERRLTIPFENGTLATEQWAMDYVDVQIENIIDNAPESLNTFKEIADYIAQDKTGANQMLASINKNKQDIANNTNQINVLENKKLDKEDLTYENVENAPEKINIVVRDTISADTYNEAREIQIGRDKFKFGSGSKIKANEFVDGTLPTLEYLNIDGKTYKVPNLVTDGNLKLVAEGPLKWNEEIEYFEMPYQLESGKHYSIQILYEGDCRIIFNGLYYNGELFANVSKDLYSDIFLALTITGNQLFFWDKDCTVAYDMFLEGCSYKIYEIPIGESAQVEKHNKTINALLERVSDLEQKAGLTSVGYVQDSTLNLIRVNVVDDVLEVSGFKFDGEVMII